MIDATQTKPTSGKLTETSTTIPLANIEPHPSNPREDFGETELDSLAASLGKTGLLQDVVVRPLAKGRYQLICGARRFHAARRAGWKSIDAKVRILSDPDAVLAMITENMERQQLNPIEQARALELLCRPVDQGGCGLTKRAAALLFKKANESWASNLIGLLKLPEPWRQRIARGEICATMGRTLIAFAENDQILRAVADDLARRPERWQTRAAWAENVQTIADAFGDVSKTLAVRRANGTSPPRPASPPAAAESSKPARRAAPVKIAAEGPQLRPKTPRRLLTDEDVQNLLQPYGASPADLQAIVEHAEQLLADWACPQKS